jgi:hypothetical protein
VGRTVTGRVAAGLCLAALACGEPGGPAASAPRIDYADGALEPVLVRGQTVTIEGFGFGAVQGGGAVRFPRIGGGSVDAPVPDSASWSDLTISTRVPDSAAAGTATLSVVTAAGRVLSLQVHVLPAAPFNPTTLQWAARTAFPRAPLGVALAAAEFPSTGGGLATTLYAAGGAEPLGGDSVFQSDSGVYVAAAQPGGAIGAWVRQHDTTDAARTRVLPAPRAFAAAAVATRYNSRFDGGALYVIGGIDAAGRASATVLGASMDAGGVTSAFAFLEPLPAPRCGAIAVVRRGRIYVMGGTDSLGRPQQGVYIGRIGVDGRIDGWYLEPPLSGARAYGGGLVLDRRVVAFGGVADSVPPGGGLDSAPARLASSDTASFSPASGFLTGAWAAAAPPLPEGRSQFATLDLGSVVLAVGGYYASVGTSPVETLAATVTGDSLGPFAGPVGTNTISGDLGGGTLVGPAGITWREADGSRHGLVLGGFDLATRLRRTGVWGF